MVEKTKFQIRYEKERLRQAINYQVRKLGRKLTDEEIKELKKNRRKPKTDRKLYQHIKYIERKEGRELSDSEKERVKNGEY